MLLPDDLQTADPVFALRLIRVWLPIHQPTFP